MNTNSPPTQPRLVVRLGVVGARDLRTGPTEPDDKAASKQRLADIRAAAETPALRNAIVGVLNALGDRAAGVVGEKGSWYESTRPTVRVVSGLADGADQLVAELALTGLGGDRRFDAEVHAVLPFEPSVYRNHTILNEDRFNRQLEGKPGTCAAKVLVIDGVFDPEDRRKRHRGFQAQAYFLLQQSDVLLAVWNPEREGQAGGSEETIRRALRGGIPVVWINPATPNDVRHLLEPADLDRKRDEAEFLDRFASQLRIIPDSTPLPTAHQPRVESAMEITEFFDGRRPAESRLNAYWELVARRLGGPKAQLPTETATAITEFEPYRSRAMDLANHYTGLYRGSFTLLYSLAAAAVFLTALTGAVGSLSDWLGQGAGLVILGILALLDLACLGLAIHYRRAAVSGGWHQKSVDYRLLSELFHQTKYLAPLGLTVPSSRLAPMYADRDPRRTWMYGLFRAVVRSQPAVLPEQNETSPFRFTESYLTARVREIGDGWAGHQAVYHQHNVADRMARMHDRIRRLVQFLSAVVVVCLLVHAVMLAGHLFAAGRGGRPSLGEAILERATIVVCLSCPAAILGLLLFRYQAECGRLRQRSAQMAEQLRATQAKFHRLAATPNPNGAWSADVAAETLRLARVMIDEVAEWQALYEIHEIPEVG